jgi:hypothetical protein
MLLRQGAVKRRQGLVKVTDRERGDVEVLSLPGPLVVASVPSPPRRSSPTALPPYRERRETVRARFCCLYPSPLSPGGVGVRWERGAGGVRGPTAPRSFDSRDLLLRSPLPTRAAQSHPRAELLHPHSALFPLRERLLPNRLHRSRSQASAALVQGVLPTVLASGVAIPPEIAVDLPSPSNRDKMCSNKLE